MNSHILPFAEPDAKIRLMFMDEARYGRINEPERCWAPEGIRPVVLCQMIRDYVEVYGAVDPIHGDKCFVIAPRCNTQWTNAFLDVLSKRFERDYILVCADQAAWHKSKDVVLPDNIRMFYLPARTPEMNPIEQLWPEVRHDFKNRMFKNNNLLIDELCVSLNSLTDSVIKSVTGRKWVLSMF
jgi:putative transposase